MSKSFPVVENPDVIVLPPKEMEDEIIQVEDNLTKAISILVEAANLSEDQSLAVADFYPDWKINAAYEIGKILRYDGDLYAVLQAHTSQADWLPSETAALYKQLGFTESGLSIWVQPISAVDAYHKDDEVSHKDKIWQSDINGNVWEPGVYGWRQKN